MRFLNTIEKKKLRPWTEDLITERFGSHYFIFHYLIITLFYLSSFSL
jgi:hypothetical protein